MSAKINFRIFPIVVVVVFILNLSCQRAEVTDNSNTSELIGDSATCNEYGAPPIQTVWPVTDTLNCEDGRQLQYIQGTTMRYACLNYPDQEGTEDYKWPLIVYLHGSLVKPTSLYTFGRDFFNLRNDAKLSSNDSIKGFIILSPEGRRAKPWSNGAGPATGTGYHWDEWYRNADDNLDALAIDHFIDQVIDSGKVDTSRIYVFGWSNGAYMTVLYSTWRSSRIAAMGQYAGANPWTRTPCPIPMSYSRQVPLFLMRNLCDKLVPCDTTDLWIDTLTGRGWPFKYHNLGWLGEFVSKKDPCSTNPECNGYLGLFEHLRWPRTTSLKFMLEYFKNHPLDQSVDRVPESSND